jgi:hypothetical protein
LARSVRAADPQRVQTLDAQYWADKGVPMAALVFANSTRYHSRSVTISVAA